MRHRLLLAVALVASSLVGAGAAVAVLHVADEPSRLDLSGGEGFTAVVQDDPWAGSTYSVAVAKVCATDTDPIDIDDVRAAHHTSNLRVTGFAVGAPSAVGGRRAAEDLAAFTARLDQGSGRLGDAHRLESVCGENDWNYTRRPLVVELQIDDDPAGQAVLQGIEIDYRVDGAARTARSDNGVLFCTGDETPEDDAEVATEIGLATDAHLCGAAVAD